MVVYSAAWHRNATEIHLGSADGSFHRWRNSWWALFTLWGSRDHCCSEGRVDEKVFTHRFDCVGFALWPLYLRSKAYCFFLNLLVRNHPVISFWHLFVETNKILLILPTWKSEKTNYLSFYRSNSCAGWAVGEQCTRAFKAMGYEYAPVQCLADTLCSRRGRCPVRPSSIDF